MRELAGRIALVLGSTVLALFMAEIAVRVLDVPPRPFASLPVPSYQLSDNPVIAYEYRPGTTPADQAFDVSHRGYRINAAGFRDRDHPLEKPPGAFRVLVLGDSTTAGNGIPDVADTFSKQLEQLLADHARPRVEVLNMGVGGYHTMQEAETLRVKGLAYEPDLVLLTLCHNDFDLHSDGGVYQALRRRNPRSPEPSRSAAYRALLRGSRLAFIAHHRLGASVSAHDAWYEAEILKGRTTVRAGLELLAALQAEHGFAVEVLILPRFSEPVDRYAAHDVHQRVFDAAAGLDGVVVVDLLEHFAAVEADLRLFGRDPLHLNERGHRVMAEILVPRVLAHLPDHERP